MGFQNLSRMFRDQLSAPTTNENHEEKIRLATAAVLLDTAYADQSFSLAEEKNVVEYLRKNFNLSEESALQLVEAAAELRNHTIDHWNLTHMIRKSASLEERIEMVKAMWRIAYADGNLHQYEEYLVRKMADLLGLEHHVMIEAKLAVRGERVS